MLNLMFSGEIRKATALCGFFQNSLRPFKIN